MDCPTISSSDRQHRPLDVLHDAVGDLKIWLSQWPSDYILVGLGDGLLRPESPEERVLYSATLDGLQSPKAWSGPRLLSVTSWNDVGSHMACTLVRAKHLFCTWRCLIDHRVDDLELSTAELAVRTSVCMNHHRCV